MQVILFYPERDKWPINFHNSEKFHPENMNEKFYVILYNIGFIIFTEIKRRFSRWFFFAHFNMSVPGFDRVVSGVSYRPLFVRVAPARAPVQNIFFFSMLVANLPLLHRRLIFYRFRQFFCFCDRCKRKNQTFRPRSRLSMNLFNFLSRKAESDKIFEVRAIKLLENLARQRRENRFVIRLGSGMVIWRKRELLFLLADSCKML